MLLFQEYFTPESYLNIVLEIIDKSRYLIAARHFFVVVSKSLITVLFKKYDYKAVWWMQIQNNMIRV